MSIAFGSRREQKARGRAHVPQETTMTAHVITAMFLLTGLLHLLPVAGVVGSERLSSLYGIPVDEPNLEILMRHRGVLFGLLGVFLIWAGFHPEWQPAGFVAGFVSVLSFLALAHSVGNYNTAVRKVFLGDVVALLCLVVAATLYGFHTL